MNITISRRSKSYNNFLNTRNLSKQVENQQSALTHQQTIAKKNHSLNKKTNVEQHYFCTNWLLKRCLKKPSIFDDDFMDDQHGTIQKTKEIHNSLGTKVEKRAIKIEGEQKIKLTSRKSKQLFNRPQCKITVVCNPNLKKQIQKTQKLSKLVYLQRQMHPISVQDPKQYLQPFKSQIMNNHRTNEKKKYKQMDFSLKPSTVVSSNNNSCHQVKGSFTKLKLSNNFQSLMETGLRPFSFNTEQKPSCEQKHVQEDLKWQKPPSEEAFEHHLSRLQLVYPSQNQFKIQDPQKSNFSINTSYIRKRIQFSSQQSDKAKFQNYVYEPVYAINNPYEDSDKKNLNNYNSEIIKNIKIEDQEYFNSAKLYSQQSMVLEKGLDQIFNLSPTFHRINSQQNSQKSEEKHIIIQNIDAYDLYSKDIIVNYARKDEIKEA